MARPADRPPAGIALEWWLAGGLFVLVQAALLAMVFTPAPHPGGDNAGYLALGHALAEGAGYVELWAPGAPAHTKYPPIFPGLLAALMTLGVASWTAFKAVGALLVSLAGILVFMWAGGRRGALPGLAVALLTMMSSGWLEASRWILSEPLFLVFVFGALWAGDRALSTSGGEADGGADREVSEGRPGGRGGTGWVVVGAGAALLALFTRSAGLPLVLAFVGALLLARRWWSAGALGGVAGVLGGLWFLRSRSEAEGAYQAEFWMVNPYEPALGTIDALGLAGRVVANAVTYVGRVIPGEWWGGAGGWAAVLGIVLVGLALFGWGSRMVRGWRGRAIPRAPAGGTGSDSSPMRSRKSGVESPVAIGPAELFLPLYAGLILVWPEVWAGDRFVLPLYPLLLLYAGEAVRELTARFGWRSGWILAVGVLALAGPAVPGVLEKAEAASECRAVGAEDPFRCLGAPMMEFRQAAGFAGMALPEDALVLSRKPRIFHVLGGGAGQTFPFTTDPAAFLRTADEAGARYLVVDALDGVSMRYLPPLLQSAPGAFCWIRGWGDYTDLLGILPVTERGGGEIHPCPAEYARELAEGAGRPVDPGRVPIL